MDRQTDYNWLIQRYQKGDVNALRKVIREFHPKLKQVIYNTTKNQAAVDDLTQECWYSIIPKLADLKLKISFEAWALTIARRRAIDWIRSQQRLRKQEKILRSEAQAEMQDAKPDLAEEKLEKIRIGIQQLPATHQIVLNMFYLENLSLSEISSVLDISKGTAKSRLFYAREKLKSIINIKQQ